MQKKNIKETKHDSIENQHNPTSISNFWMVLLIAFVCGVFFIAHKNNFVVWDDPRYVYENELINNPTFSNLIKLFQSVVLLNYHPITMLSLWLNAFVFGLKPASFILTNILLHAINTYLVYRLILALLPKNFTVAYLTALIWAIHPMHVESVVWVSERKDLLYTLFFLSGCLSYLKYEKENGKWLRITYLLFILSCLSKPMAIVFPAVLLLIDYWQGKKIFSWEVLSSKIPFFIISIFFFWISFNTLSNGDFYGLLEKSTSSRQVTINNYSFLERICFGSYSLWIYLIKLVVPVQLHHWYIFPEKSTLVYFSPIILFLLVGILYFSFKKKKIVFWGLCFFLVNIILVLQIFPVSIVLMAERYTYLSYLGLIFLLVNLSSEYFSSKTILGGGIVITIIFSYLTFQQVKVWKNTVSLWENNFKYHPNHTETAIALINNYRAENNQEKALEIAEKSINAGNKDANVFYSAANIYIAKEDYQNALKNLNNAQKYLNIDDSELKKSIYLGKGAVYNWLAKPDSAIFYLQKVQLIK